MDCGPDPGRIRVLTPTCPFNEKQVLQLSVDGGGEPENLTFQWQWAETRDGPWNDYNPPAGYVSMIEQAGNRFEAPVALNCTPENINGLGLIEAYETAANRARQFSIDAGISFDPANLALLLIKSQISDLYMLLANEAFADATDPTIGFFGNETPTNPSALFCFEGRVDNLLSEELALLRGTSEQVPPLTDIDGFIIATPYNRLLWNFNPGGVDPCPWQKAHPARCVLQGDMVMPFES